jgi:hypothetical protein
MAVENRKRLQSAASFLRDVTYPRGEIKIVGVRHSPGQTFDGLEAVSADLRREQVATTWHVLDESNYEQGLITAMRTAGGGLTRPNIVFLEMPHTDAEKRYARMVLRDARSQELGVLMLDADHPGRLGGRGVINVWIREQGPDWTVSTELSHSHLAILLAYKLVRNWGGEINLVTAVRDTEQLGMARDYLRGLGELARLPGPPRACVLNDGFRAALPQAPHADLSVFALPPHVDLDLVEQITNAVMTPCVFVRDSGKENAFI